MRRLSIHFFDDGVVVEYVDEGVSMKAEFSRERFEEIGREILDLINSLTPSVAIGRVSKAEERIEVGELPETAVKELEESAKARAELEEMANKAKKVFKNGPCAC